MILILDEFDLALALSDKQDLLMSLRSYKVKVRQGGRLLSFFGVGTYQMRKLVEQGQVWC